MTRHSDVLIVGAGPTGLALAAVLVQRGVGVRLVDKHPSLLEMSKAAALHARAMEYFEDLGVAGRILAEGQRVDVLTLRTRYRDRLSVDFRDVADTAFPFMVDIPQNRTEHLLADRLAELGLTAERRVELLAATAGPQVVTVSLRHADGSVETATADWLVGADGVHSRVRHIAGISFAGAPYADDWVLCDAELDWPLPRDEMTFSSDAEGIYGVFPLPGERRYRLAYTQSRTPDGRVVEPGPADAQRALARTGISGRITSADQFSTFNLAHRQAGHLRAGRMFLVGDAGHVHTPFGGQGLNLGIGDAVNLGWKLAAVVRGEAPEALLDSYEPERHRVGEQVVRFTHIGAEAMLRRSGAPAGLRDLVMAGLRTVPAARRLLAHRLSQVAHTYRGTPLVSGRAGTLHAGDRLPDVALFDGLAQRPRRLSEVLTPGRYALLVTDDSGRLGDPGRLASHLLGSYAPRADVVLLSADWAQARRGREAGLRVVLDRGRQARRLYGRRPLALLVRPDRHLGFVGRADRDPLQRHLALVMTAGTSAAVPAAGTVSAR